MMIRYVLATLLLITSSSILAGEPRPPKKPPEQSPPIAIDTQSTSVATSLSHSKSDADSHSKSSVGNVTGGEATVGDVISNGGLSKSSVGDTSQANQQNINIEGDEQRGTVRIKNTPSAIAPDVYPTVSCFKPQVNGALSLPGFGFSGSKGKIDQDCVKREYIRLAAQMGMMNRATFMWCKQPAVYEDFGSEADCLLFEVDRVAATDVDELDESLPLIAQISEEQYTEDQQQLLEKENQYREELDSLRKRGSNLTQQIKALQQVQMERVKREDTQRKKLQALLEINPNG